MRWAISLWPWKLSSILAFQIYVICLNFCFKALHGQLWAYEPKTTIKSFVYVLAPNSKSLLFDGKIVGSWSRTLENRSITNNNLSKETVLQDDNCKHADLIKASTGILLISIVSKHPNSRSQNVSSPISKRSNLQSQNDPTYQLSQNVPTHSLKMAQLYIILQLIRAFPDYILWIYRT